MPSRIGRQTPMSKKTSTKHNAEILDGIPAGVWDDYWATQEGEYKLGNYDDLLLPPRHASRRSRSFVVGRHSLRKALSRRHQVALQRILHMSLAYAV